MTKQDDALRASLTKQYDELHRHARAGLYGIWCVVSGGRTGTREAWHKRGDSIAMWADPAKAQAEADRLNARMNHSLSVATFHYTVKER